MGSRTCFVSCVDSGPNPSPGLGVARSMRDAYPDAHLVAVAYSEQTSGFHDPVFDDVWMNRPWDELDLEHYANQIAERISDGALFLSNLDLEAKWLAQALGPRSRLPVPSPEAFEQVAKPDIAADSPLPMRIPEYRSVHEPDEELHAFGRRHDWSCWLKGPSHEALPITHWKDLASARQELEERWATDALFLQAHREGREESVLFAAHEGTLLGAVRMQKTRTTGASKTWSGRLLPLDDAFEDALRQTVSALNWTGGSEIECVRDAGDALWVIDWNPRFPGWVYGATVNGFNAPAALAAACWGEDIPLPSLDADASPAEFTRVVTEIPVRTSVPFEESDRSPFAVSTKVPTDMPALAHRLRGGSDVGPASARRSSGDGRPSGTHSAAAQGELSPSLQAIAGDLPDPLPPSPASLLLPTRTPERFRRFGNAATTVAHAFDRLGESLDFQVAYSVKTNPHPDLIDAAREAGFWAETIHPDEIRHVRSRGFPPDQIVLNGPLQHGLHDRLPSLRAAFADSIGDLAEMLEADRLPAIAGLRIRPAEPLSSRFGVDLNDPDRFDRCCELVSAMPPEVQFGLHVHHASSTAGHERWWDYLRSAVHWGKAIQSVTGRAVEVLDFGGGWHPDDWLDVFIPGLIDRAAALRDAFPDLSRLIAEPGKALCQPLGVVVSRVVDVRRESDGSTTAVVDASIAELSNVDFHPHRVLARSRSAGNGSEGGDWYRLTRGSGTLYGRLCMEEDVLAGPVDLRGLEPGDPVVFCDAGAYDMSMTYPFGRGRTATAPDYEGGPSSRSDGSPSDGRERLSPNPPTPPRPNS